MANVAFCYPNWTLKTKFVTPQISGAGWIDLEKMQGQVLSEMARFPGVEPTQTKLVIDLGELRAARIFAIPLSNAKTGDTARIRFAADANFTDVAFDTGVSDFYGVVYPYGSLEWGRVEWLDGRLTREQTDGVRPSWRHIAPAPVLGRYVEVSLDFSNNTDGFVDLGQVVISLSFSPAYNASYGCKPPFYRDASTTTRSKGGVVFADVQEKYRVTSMQLDYLGENEAYGNFFEMVRQYGKTKPFYFIYDTDAAAPFLDKQSFMACAESMGEPTLTSFNNYSLPIQISEQF